MSITTISDLQCFDNDGEYRQWAADNCPALFKGHGTSRLLKSRRTALAASERLLKSRIGVQLTNGCPDGYWQFATVDEGNLCRLYQVFTNRP